VTWIHEHWQELLSLLGLIVWLVRMEGKTTHSEKRICHLEQQVENLESGLVKEISEVKQALARIEGYLKAKSEVE
jgi:hypothetical protein